MFQLSQTLLILKLRQNCLSNITTHYDNAMNIWEYFEKIILHKNILVPNGKIFQNNYNLSAEKISIKPKLAVAKIDKYFHIFILNIFINS